MDDDLLPVIDINVVSQNIGDAASAFILLAVAAGGLAGVAITGGGLAHFNLRQHDPRISVVPGFLMIIFGVALVFSGLFYLTNTQTLFETSEAWIYRASGDPDWFRTLAWAVQNVLRAIGFVAFSFGLMNLSLAGREDNHWVDRRFTKGMFQVGCGYLLMVYGNVITVTLHTMSLGSPFT